MFIVRIVSSSSFNIDFGHSEDGKKEELQIAVDILLDQGPRRAGVSSYLG